jgi:peptide/nickel transport system permease protein
MGRYLARRLGFAVLLVFVVSSSALLLTRLAPGDFATGQGLDLDAASRERLRLDLGLDRPIAQQYLSWLGGVVRLDFGTSLLYSRPVSAIVGERAVNTAVLAAIALIVATMVGVPLGIYSGTRTGPGRSIVRTLSIIGLSVPPLIGSLALVFVAARTGWFPVGGMTSSSSGALSATAWLADLARHLPLPALALAIPLAASLERLQSEAIAAAAHESFVAASQARGAARLRAILHHAWPVSLRPVLGFYGVMIGSLFSGSFIVEVVTSWPGLGRLMFDALKARDLFLVAGCAATGAVFLAAGTLIADLLLAYTDPRVRSGERT